MHIGSAQTVNRASRMRDNPRHLPGAPGREPRKQHLESAVPVRLIEASAPPPQLPDGHISLHA